MGFTFPLHGGPSISEEYGHEHVQVAVRLHAVAAEDYAAHHGPQHLIQ